MMINDRLYNYIAHGCIIYFIGLGSTGWQHPWLSPTARLWWMPCLWGPLSWRSSTELMWRSGRNPTGHTKVEVNKLRYSTSKAWGNTIGFIKLYKCNRGQNRFLLRCCSSGCKKTVAISYYMDTVIHYHYCILLGVVACLTSKALGFGCAPAGLDDLAINMSNTCVLGWCHSHGHVALDSCQIMTIYSHNDIP